YHTIAIGTDGTLWAWGANTYGQLGDGTTVNSSSPKQIGAAINWSSITAGSNHTLAIKSDGTLFGFGRNNYGQLTGLILPHDIVAPLTENVSFTMSKNTSKTFTSSDFTFRDPNPTDSLKNIYITSLPSAGTLQLNSVDVALNQEINTSSISNLVFTPVADAVASPYTSFSFKVNDGENNSTLSYTSTINVIDNPPTLAAISNMNLAEDASPVTIQLAGNDVNGDTLSYTASSSNTNIARVSLVGNALTISPVANASGTIQVTATVTASAKSASRTFTVSISAVNDAPVITTGFNTLNLLEDAPGFAVNMNIGDIEGNTLSVSITSNNPALVSVTPNFASSLSSLSYAGKTLSFNVGLGANAYGSATVTIQVSDGVASVTKSFIINVASVNDFPIVSTELNTVNVLEDADILTLNMNVNDIDGDALSITVESDQPSLVSVTQDFANTLNTGEYSDIPLAFKLKIAENANGVATITVTLNDGVKTITKTFTINVTSVNDAPILEDIPQLVVYKNFSDQNITLVVTDIDSNAITYSATAVDPSLISGITFTNNIMTISSLSGASGSTDITVVANDGENNSSKTFNLNIIALALGDNVEQSATSEITTTQESTTTKFTLENDLSLQIQENTDGTSTQEIQVAGVSVKTISELSNATTEFTSEGVSTSYNDANMALSVTNSATGTTTSELSIADLITKVISDFIGALTQITRDTNGNVEIRTSLSVKIDSLISVTSKADGTSQSNVRNADITSSVSSQIAGSTTVVKTDGEVEMTAGELEEEPGYMTKAVVRTRADGEMRSEFIRVSKSDPSDVRVLHSTLSRNSRFPAGSKTDVLRIENRIFIKTRVSLTQNLNI
ncbi:hypothetical protein JHD49_03150, partial [Sulfurimonas sp. SAG-AH-194-C21]